MSDDNEVKSPGQIGNYRFLIEISDVTKGKSTAGYFKSMSGLSSKQETIEYRLGGDPSIRRKPGRVSFSNLVLEQGYTADETLFKWRKEIAQGKKTKKDGSIVILKHAGDEEEARWNFFRAWPVSWDGPGLAAGAAETAVEKLELAVEWVEYEKV